MKQILFVHCAGVQSAEQGSGPLLTALRNEFAGEYELIAPLMPNDEEPTYAAWKEALLQELPKLQEGVLLVGHSLGGSVLLKMLAEQQFPVSCAGLMLLATPKWGADEDWQSEAYELPQPIADFLPPIPKILLYHSTDDHVVPFRHAELYLQALPTAELRAFTNEGHYFHKPNRLLLDDVRSFLYTGS